MRAFGLAFLAPFFIFLINSCALYQGQQQQNTSLDNTSASTSSPPPSSSPSPLNTSANPWTNVSPQVQGQIARERPNVRR